eukprot:scpid86006/ scgid13050/ 
MASRCTSWHIWTALLGVSTDLQSPHKKSEVYHCDHQPPNYKSNNSFVTPPQADHAGIPLAFSSKAAMTCAISSCKALYCMHAWHNSPTAGSTSSFYSVRTGRPGQLQHVQFHTAFNQRL